MSRENVEVVRRIYEAVARRDGVSAFELYAEDIDWDVSRWRRTFLYRKPVYHGHEGVREAWREVLSAFGEVEVEVEELIDTDDKVVAVIGERSTGRHSGARVPASHAAVWTLTGGRVTRMEAFDHRDDAIQALGLRE